MKPARSPRVLVVFFSRSGATRQVAEAIARATSADCEELREHRSRRGFVGWLRSGYEGTYRRSSATLPLEHDLGRYDLIFVGSPTWNRALCSPVRGFLLAHRHELKNLALFATCQGHGADAVLDEMAQLTEQTPLARLALLESDARRGAAVEVGELVEAARQAWEQRAEPAGRCCADARADLAEPQEITHAPR